MSHRLAAAGAAALMLCATPGYAITRTVTTTADSGAGSRIGNGAVDVGDVFSLIDTLFAGGPAPV